MWPNEQLVVVQSHFWFTNSASDLFKSEVTSSSDVQLITIQQLCDLDLTTQGLEILCDTSSPLISLILEAILMNTNFSLDLSDDLAMQPRTHCRDLAQCTLPPPSSLVAKTFPTETQSPAISASLQYLITQQYFSNFNASTFFLNARA